MAVRDVVFGLTGLVRTAGLQTHQISPPGEGGGSEGEEPVGGDPWGGKCGTQIPLAAAP